MSAYTKEEIRTRRGIVSHHNSLMAQHRTEQNRQAKDPRANLARNVSIIADMLRCILLLMVVVVGYLAYRYVL